MLLPFQLLQVLGVSIWILELAPVSKTKPAEILIGIETHIVFSVDPFFWSCHLVAPTPAAVGSNEHLGGKMPAVVKGEGISVYKALLETFCTDHRVSGCDIFG